MRNSLLFNGYFYLELRLYQLSQKEMNNEGNSFIGSAVNSGTHKRFLIFTTKRQRDSEPQKPCTNWYVQGSNPNLYWASQTTCIRCTWPWVAEQKLNTSYTAKKALVCKIKSLERFMKMNKFKGFSKMVLRLVSGPMLEKRNKIGPLADRQKSG